MNADGQGQFVVVGAGPAGLMAAVAAARAGRAVTVLEHKPRPGLKLLATGGGRCNLTNLLPPAELMNRFGRQGRFMQPALAALDGAGLRRFFAGLGVPTHAADGFHVFPVAESAQAVLDALLGEARRLGVRLRCDCGVRTLARHDQGWRVILPDGAAINAATVLLATGGCSYAGLGADGSGYRLARELGHTVTPPVPALVPLLAAAEWPRQLAGITFPDVELRIAHARCRRLAWRGALLFTHRGVSGPAVLDASGEVAALLAAAEPVELRIALWPGRDGAVWRQWLATARREQGGKLLRTVLAGECPAAVATALCEVAGVGEERVARLTRQQEEKLLEILLAVPLAVTGTEGLGHAMVTRGGVCLKEIEPRSMASRLAPGLFFAGELVDLDGPCGGYNLQWAFSSGWLAGSSQPTVSPPND